MSLLLIAKGVKLASELWKRSLCGLPLISFSQADLNAVICSLSIGTLTIPSGTAEFANLSLLNRVDCIITSTSCCKD